MDIWMYKHEGENAGPLSQGELEDLIHAKRIDGNTLVLREDWTEWKTIAQTELFAAQLLEQKSQELSAGNGTWEQDKGLTWSRFLARYIDIYVFGGLIGVLLAVVIVIVVPEHKRILETIGRHDVIVGIAMLLPSMILLEVPCLVLLGTTPGKWITGIVVRENGKRLSWRAAIHRSVILWIMGLGAGIPFLNFYTMIKSDQKLKAQGLTEWDQSAGTTVRITTKPWQLYLSIAITATLIIGSRLI